MGANGLAFGWQSFDGWYGSKPPFPRALDERQQKFVGEIHKEVVGWIDPQRLTQRPCRRGSPSAAEKPKP